MAKAKTGSRVSRRRFLGATLLATGAGLVACAGGPTNPATSAPSSKPTEASKTTEAPKAAAAPSGGVTPIVFWVQGDPKAKNPWNDNRNKFNREFEQKNNVKLDLQGVVQRIDIKVLIAGAAGNQPDLTMFSSQMTGAHYHAGTLKPVDDYFKSEPESWRKDLSSIALAAVTAPNKQMLGMLQSTHSRVLYYRKDLLEKAPESWEDLITAGKKVTNTAKGDWGWVWFGGKTWNVEVEFGPYVWEQDAHLADPGTGKAAWANDATVKALELHRDALYKEKVAPLSTMTGQGYSDWKMFDNGQAAMAVNGTYMLPDFKKNATKLWEAGSIWATPIPAPTGGHSANFANGWAYGLPRLSKHPDVAWKWINTWNQPSAQVANALIEGAAPNTLSSWKDKAFESSDFGIWTKVFFPNLEKYGHPMDPFVLYIEALDALSEAIQTVLLKPDADIMATIKDAQDQYNGKYLGG